MAIQDKLKDDDAYFTKENASKGGMGKSKPSNYSFAQPTPQIPTKPVTTSPKSAIDPKAIANALLGKSVSKKLNAFGYDTSSPSTKQSNAKQTTAPAPKQTYTNTKAKATNTAAAKQTSSSSAKPTTSASATGTPISQEILNIAYAYPNKDFSEIYANILAAMGDDATLKANIEAALKPLYQQSKEDIEAQRIARNADIDVDAASRGMGNSTWVTDAKLRQLRNAENNLATLDASYNNQLYSALADAMKDRDNTAYNNAMQWWNIQRQLAEEAAAKSGGVAPSTPTITDNFEKSLNDFQNWWNDQAENNKAQFKLGGALVNTGSIGRMGR